MRQFFWWIVLAVLVSCETRRTAQIEGMGQGSPVPMLHAANLFMSQYDDITLAVLRNPWDTTQILHRYVFIPDTIVALPDIPADVTVVRTPIRQAVVYTGVHGKLLYDLGCIDQIAGLCDGNYVLDSVLCNRLADGRLVDYGNAMNPSLELIMDTQPDALLPSAFQNTGYGRVEKLGIPIIECADYMETSPLGRAEWMRFYGRLFGVGERADSLFDVVCQRYAEVRDSIAEIRRVRPKVMCDQLTAATWYVPGAHSTMAQWIADAGGDYIFKDNDASGSVALNLEAVLDRAHDADIWLVKYNRPQDYTYSTFAAECASYERFAPFVNRCMFSCNTGRIPFYEEVPFHPERLLTDFASIFAGQGNTQYYFPFNE